MSYNISEKQINEFKEAFSLYDPQNLGALPITELGKLMRSVGQTPTEKEVQEIIRTLKEEGKQTMDFQDFLQIMAKNMKDCIPEEKVIEAFKVFDKEGKGLISAQELRHIMTSIGEKLTEEEADEMMKEAEIDKNGNIDYAAFVKKMVSL